MSKRPKPCPLCGSSHIAIGVDENKKPVSIRCITCGYKLDAVASWNTRPIEDAQAAEIEALTAKVAELENDNARMREALEKIDTLDMKNPYPDRPWKWGIMDKVWQEHAEMKRIAKQALLKGEG